MWLSKPHSMESGSMHLKIYTAKRLAQHTSLHMQHKKWIIPHSTHSTSSGSSQLQHVENKNWPTTPNIILGSCEHNYSCGSVFSRAYRLNGKTDDKPFLICTVFLIFVPTLCWVQKDVSSPPCMSLLWSNNPVCMVHTIAEFRSCPWSVLYQQHSDMCSSCQASRPSWQRSLTGTSLPMALHHIQKNEGCGARAGFLAHPFYIYKMVSADNRVEAGWRCFHFTCALSPLRQITAALFMASLQSLGCL
jgi:hypothetical protein